MTFEEVMRGIVLSEITDRKLLEKIVGKVVYRRSGEKVGKIWKIYVSKREKQPIKVVLKTDSNGKIVVPPERIRVENNRIILLDHSQEAILSIIGRLSDIAEELRKLRDELLVLDEKLISGEIPREEYNVARSRIERKKVHLRMEASTLLDALNHMVQSGEVTLNKEEERRIYEIMDVLSLSLPAIPLRELEKIFG
ncbi:PRC-barrel domain-containing protein [Thermofilum pendens]|nr:PRC-barrel domain-containing protein [Thermofilum pendens]